MLFFTGAWVSGDDALNCTDGDQPQPDSAKLANAQRIGVAYRYGPSNTCCQRPIVHLLFNVNKTSPIRNATSSRYTLLDGGPILGTRPGKWDSTRVSNPAAVIYANGSVLLAYRGNGKGRGGVGVAVAPHWKGPYTHIYDEPLCEC